LDFWVIWHSKYPAISNKNGKKNKWYRKNIKLTALAFANFSSHFTTSSAETLRLDKSIYPKSTGYEELWAAFSKRKRNVGNYISDALTPVSRVPSRGRLRSADTTDYLVPWTRSKFGERAFCVSGPLVWKSLPESLRTVDSITTFRRRLKTHFFNIYLSWFYIHCFSF